MLKAKLQKPLLPKEQQYILETDCEHHKPVIKEQVYLF